MTRHKEQGASSTAPLIGPPSPDRRIIAEQEVDDPTNEEVEEVEDGAMIVSTAN